MATEVRRAVVLCLFCVACIPLSGAAESGPFSNDPNATKYAVILVGAAVDQQRADRFAKWALNLHESLHEDYGYGEEEVYWLMGNDADPKVDGPCNGDTIGRTFQTLAKQVETNDQVSVFLIGHGTGRGAQAKFNIVGPDLNGSQFAAMLNSIRTQNMVVVNTTSASYDFSKALSAEGRVVVSATRSPAEKYDTVFPGFFIEGLQGRAADRDKNQRVSVLEAFTFARARVKEYFDQRETLPTEHATLDDDGDGRFSVDPDGGDGRLAEIAYLDVPRAGTAGLTPDAARLRREMADLEREIFLLRANKSSVSESEYWTQLEPLLIELAKVTREFDGLSTP